MLTSDFDYNLPPEFIAQTPAEPRDSSRLMVVDKKTRGTKRERFYDIVNFLQEGDLLVWNSSKVFKARLSGEILLDVPSDDVPDAREAEIHPTGKILNIPKKVEIFLIRPMENKFVWRVLAKPGRKLRLGMKIRFASDFEGEVMLKEKDGTILMQFADEDFIVREKANKYGEVPLPPYVRTLDARLLSLDDKKVQSLKTSDQYQTVYAKSEGSVAAPTAGFHFTQELIEKLKKKGVQFAEVTLHVGLGTFLPVKTDVVEKHVMHSEWVELTAKNADLINAAKAEGRRIVAVGTTTVRTLEGIARLDSSLLTLDSSDGTKQSTKVPARNTTQGVAGGQRLKTKVRPYTGDLNIFITPGFKFQVVDALITNFHLPKSTLLMLVSAFVGDTAFVLKCYEEAMREKYRFYSFGDAMFIK